MSQDLVLCWQNLSFYVTVKRRTLFKTKCSRVKLLSNVSGLVRTGELSAIMGPSGSGKTTLLASLGQRISGDLHGEVLLNGEPVDRQLMSKMSGFVAQHHLAVTSLTVSEHLQFMAWLRMDRRVSDIQRIRLMGCLMRDLGLQTAAHTTLDRLSGGERKRLSLAVELLTDPPVVLCDEPTTGLDSSTAKSVVSLLRTLASRGKAVLCSLHQPASGLFEMFDTVTLLVPGGQLAYYGPVNDAKQYFADKGMVCPPAFNTAEYVITQLNTLPEKLTESFPYSKAFAGLNKEIEAIKHSETQSRRVFGMEEKFLKFYSVQKPSRLTQLKWLTWRSVLQIFRNYQKLFLQLAMYVLTACVVALPYVGLELDQEAIQNMQGLNYSVITETVFFQSYAILHTFPAEIPILLREMGNGVYQPAPYYLSKVLLQIPRSVVEVLIFCLVVHWLAGPSPNFLTFAFPVIVTGIASSAYGCCISAMFESVNSASLLAVPLDFISYTFSGLFLQLTTVPIYLSWVKYISRFYYGLEAVSILQWTRVPEIPCSSNPSVPCISSGIGVLLKYGYNPNNLIFDFLCLVIMFIVLHSIGYAFLKKRSKKHSVY